MSDAPDIPHVPDSPAPALFQQGVRVCALAGAGFGMDHFYHSETINGLVAPVVVPFLATVAVAVAVWVWSAIHELRSHKVKVALKAAVVAAQP